MGTTKPSPKIVWPAMSVVSPSGTEKNEKNPRRLTAIIISGKRILPEKNPITRPIYFCAPYTKSVPSETDNKTEENATINEVRNTCQISLLEKRDRYHRRLNPDQVYNTSDALKEKRIKITIGR